MNLQKDIFVLNFSQYLFGKNPLGQFVQSLTENKINCMHKCKVHSILDATVIIVMNLLLMQWPVLHITVKYETLACECKLASK
jgi:hypothetical protein